MHDQFNSLWKKYMKDFIRWFKLSINYRLFLTTNCAKFSKCSNNVTRNPGHSNNNESWRDGGYRFVKVTKWTLTKMKARLCWLWPVTPFPENREGRKAGWNREIFIDEWCMRTMLADRQVATREFIFSARSPHERRLFVVRFLRLPPSLSLFLHCSPSSIRFFSLGFEYFNGRARRRRIEKEMEGGVVRNEW